ncbi:MAG: helix-turn-helix domain-containing protein [Mycobacteriales bacterium]
MPTRTDLTRRRLGLSRAWESLAADPRASAACDDAVRPDVLDSWRRSSHWVDPECAAAPLDDPATVVGQWQGGRTAQALVLVEDEVARVVSDGDLIAAVTDRAGRIVWTCGSSVMRTAAARVNFVPGGRWDEASVGTNALALALRTGQPSTVYSAEHFSRAVHGWVCYSVPLKDPATGQVLGVLDLSTTWDRAHPLAMSAARSLGAAITASLPAQRGAPQLSVSALGTAQVRLGGASVTLSRRQSEILVLLALSPAGLTLEQLHDRLYGDAPVTASTLKAEVSHLRTLLGGAIGSRPYRLTAAVSTDVHRVLAALERGDLPGAVASYGGPLLASSDSPGVVEWRSYVDVALRSAVLLSDDVAAVLGFADRHPYDEQLQQHLLRVLPVGDPRRPLALARVDRAG